MKFYECEHYGLVYQSDSCFQYHACKKEHDGREYADCKKENCELLKEKSITMNELLNLQDLLDRKIQYNLAEKGVKVTEKELLNSKQIALFTEVAEFCNELQSFKYWKQNKSVNEKALIEEFVDILFFWLSLANQLEFTAADLENAYMDKYRENLKRQKENY
jgi:dimeric dUTPase (all-alpha-NTP-PPase superfamily)